MEFLKQSTACSFTVGPMVDTTSLVAQTGLTVTNVSMIKIGKHDAAALTDIIANAFTHLANGVYKQALSVADTNTVGRLEYHLGATSAQPQHREFMVLPANVFDSIVGGTDLLDINIDQVNQNSTAGDNLLQSTKGVVQATIQAGSSVTVLPTNLTEATNDHYNGRTLIFTSGAMQGQATSVTDYNGTTKEITCPTLTEAPANGVTFVIV